MLFEIARLNADWEQGQNRDRAVAVARTFMEGLRDGRIEPVANLERMKAAAEPLWDGEDGDPQLVRTAVNDVQRAFRQAERFGGLKDPARLMVRVEPQVLLARAELRAGRGREAFLVSHAVLVWLEDFAGGSAALRDIIARPTPNPAAECAVAILGIYPAALRRSGLPLIIGTQYEQIGRQLVRAYMNTDRRPTVYPRTAALASQWLYHVIRADHGGAERDLVRRLYELDLMTRPPHLRGQATRALRDLEYARYLGAAADVERHKEQVTEDLRISGLARHQQVVEAYGYLAA